RRRGRRGARHPARYGLDPAAPRASRAARGAPRAAAVTPAACRRSWMAEAIEDGRLGHAPRAASSFLKHAAACAACPCGVRATGAVSNRTRALPGPVLSEIHHGRRRRRLLAVAEGTPATTAGRWRGIAIAASGAVLVGAAAAHIRADHLAAPRPV